MAESPWVGGGARAAVEREPEAGGGAAAAAGRVTRRGLACLELYRLEEWQARPRWPVSSSGWKDPAGTGSGSLDAAKRHIGEPCARAAERRLPDERNDLRDDGAALWSRAGGRCGNGRARRSGGRGGWSGVSARRAAGRQLSDALLAAIRTDLARSPFQGEGHRKVHARLRILDGVRVARTRVLRVMRAQGLPRPTAGDRVTSKAHDGTHCHLGALRHVGHRRLRVFTAQDGWVWTFAAVDHWNAECVGWLVGSRMRPSSRWTRATHGSPLRMDHQFSVTALLYPPHEPETAARALARLRPGL